MFFCKVILGKSGAFSPYPVFRDKPQYLSTDCHIVAKHDILQESIINVLDNIRGGGRSTCRLAVLRSRQKKLNTVRQNVMWKNAAPGSILCVP